MASDRDSSHKPQVDGDGHAQRGPVCVERATQRLMSLLSDGPNVPITVKSAAAF